VFLEVDVSASLRDQINAASYASETTISRHAKCLISTFVKYLQFLAKQKSSLGFPMSDFTSQRYSHCTLQ